MHPTHSLMQLLESCAEDMPAANNQLCLEFPLEEFLCAVLANQAELQESFYSLGSLSHLVEEYRGLHPNFSLTEEDLLSEGWLSPFLDRWDFGVMPRSSCTQEEEFPLAHREPIVFLRWLADRQRDSHYEIRVPQFSKILSDFRTLFPQMPSESWFVQEGYLSSDENCLSYSRRRGRGAEAGALARLWNRWSNAMEEEKVDLWLGFAGALDSMNGAFELLSYEQQQFLLSQIITRLEAGRYPDISTENRRIFRFEAWQRGAKNVCSDWQPLSGDLLSDFQTFDEQSYRWDHLLIQRKRIIYSYVQILCRHLHFLNRELFERAVNILIPLAEVGCLDEIPIPSESLFCLWSDPRTSLLACKQMFFHSISKPDIQDQLLSCTLHQIMEQVLLDRGQTDAGGTELTQLLLFFVRHSGAGRIGEAGNKALAQLLTDLKRHSQKQELYLRQIVYKLGQRMEQAKDTLDWGACFRLVCLLMREIYYGRGSLPTVRAVPSCKALRQILFNQYVRLLQSDAKFLNGVSGLLDLALFSNAFWNDIYQESRAAWKEQHMLQRPSKALQAQTSSERANSRYLCQIHLTLLTTLMQNQPDPALERYFADFLSDVFLPKYELLTCNTIIASNALSYVETAVGLVCADQDCFARFFQCMNDYDLPELILIYHGAQDDKLKTYCFSLIEGHPNRNTQLSNMLYKNVLIRLILDAKIECLYPTAEQILDQELNCWKKYPGIAFRQERNQAAAQLNQVWLNQKDYDRLLKQGNPFYQAITFMESPKHRNLKRAESLWKKLLKERVQPDCVINLVYTYSLQYEQEAQRGDKEKAQLSHILSEVENLRQSVECGAFNSWEEAAQKHYAVNLYALYRQSTQDRTALIRSLAKALGVSTDLFVDLDAKELKSAEIEPVKIPSESPVSALRTYCTATLAQKARWFFEVKSCDPTANPRRALLVWCMMNTCAHLMAYGPQLIVNDRLPEDRCTQLFRELFNQAYAEMFTLTVNDQEQTGHTSSQVRYGQGIAEVDLTFKNQGTIVAISEAMCLHSWQKNEVCGHIHQLLGNNNLDTPMFLLIYAKSSSPEELWRKYCAYLKDEFVPAFDDSCWGPAAVTKFSESEDYIPDLHNLFYFHKRMLRMTFGSPEKALPPMYHIFLSVGSQENIPVAAAARNKKHSPV